MPEVKEMPNISTTKDLYETKLSRHELEDLIELRNNISILIQKLGLNRAVADEELHKELSNKYDDLLLDANKMYDQVTSLLPK